MKRGIVIYSALLLLVLSSQGCTWVKQGPGAESVRVAAADSLEGCKKVGTTKARTKSKVGFMSRSDEKVAEELATLARNDAPELGGNTVVAEGPISEDGVQRFSIYDCPTEPESMP